MKVSVPKEEYGSFYAGYLSYSNGKNLFDLLATNQQKMKHMLNTLADDDGHFRYAPDKWTVKEMVGHIIDTERIFCYRALALARGESKPIPGYDQDHYVKAAHFNRYSLVELADQYKAARQATRSLFSGFTEKEQLRRGIVNDTPFSVRAAGYVIAGHEMHHLHIFSVRYLPGMGEVYQNSLF